MFMEAFQYKKVITSGKEIRIVFIFCGRMIACDVMHHFVIYVIALSFSNCRR